MELVIIINLHGRILARNHVIILPPFTWISLRHKHAFPLLWMVGRSCRLPFIPPLSTPTLSHTPCNLNVVVVISQQFPCLCIGGSPVMQEMGKVMEV